MTVRVDVEPDLLQWAARRAGWESRDIPSGFRDKLPRWLEGTRRPTLKQLEAFAKATHVGLGTLFLPEPPVEEIPIPDMRTLGDQALREPSANLLDTIHTCQLRQDWYRDYVAASRGPGPAFIGSLTTETPITDAARRISESLQISTLRARGFKNASSARRALVERLEEVGVLVMVSGIVGNNRYRPLDVREFRGFTLTDDLAPLIFINGADAKTAQVFTLVHELSHLWLGGSALSDATPFAEHAPAAERWCNRVAAEVLVPQSARDGALELLEDSDALRRHAESYGISSQVLLCCLRDHSLLTPDRFQALLEHERERSEQLLEEYRSTGSSGGDFYATQRYRLGLPFIQAVVSSAHEGQTLYRDAYRLLGTQSHQTFARLGETAVAA
ncbi:ImmA/IrrE family metallo-endopeptidase [Actinomyces bowdenii]|uniref:ImmA/IrrE family metallo-endopeptidase n=1 Tax=Actinomyces bowdenii TaxID=131109 RepID=A0A3P1V9P5_9ACTO|nr:ImmA/IrrE family metallo-endopeptidase [Actinomyces bowdenii]RRD30366.1 ImmA/IrrE family metallo-endopeptidase [Actinomyces bowdenii]